MLAKSWNKSYLGNMKNYPRDNSNFPRDNFSADKSRCGVRAGISH